VAQGPVLLKDIANISFGVKEETSFSRVNGKNAITVLLMNDASSNLIELSHKTQEAINTINEKYKTQDLEVMIQSNVAETMETNIDQIINLALLGGFLAVFVLWIFLKNLRIVSIVAFAIPVSVFTAFNFFYAFDISLNSLTLVGIALAVGMLLDNSVVVLENIYRLSSGNHLPDSAVTQGAKEVWRSIFAATLTTVMVFVPFLFSGNFMIKLIGQNIGISIVSTLLVSFFVALLFIPMAAHLLLKMGRNKNVFFEKVTTTNRIIQIYILLLKTSLRSPARTVIGAIALFFITIFISLSISVNTLKEAESDQFKVYITMPSGSDLEATDKVVQQVEEKLGLIQEKKDIISQVEEEEAIVTVKLQEDFDKIGGRNAADIKSAAESDLGNISTADISLTQPTSGVSYQGSSRKPGQSFERLLGIGSSGERIVIKGSDFEVMEGVAEDIQYFIENLESIQRVNVNTSGIRPEIHMFLDPLLMTEYDITLNEVSLELGGFSRQFSSGLSFKQGTDEYDIIITDGTDPEEKQDKSMDDLKGLQVTDLNGGSHDLSSFSELIYAGGKRRIIRVDQEKQIEINYAFVSEAQDSKELLESYRMDIDDIVAGYKLPPGVAVEVVHEENELEDFYFLFGAAFILIFMILASVFESMVTPFVLMFSIPLAAIGSFVALILTGNSLFNANTLTGFLILIGVVVNNSIILIDYTNILRNRGFRKSRALMVAGLSRVRPILITAITTIVAMLPLALGKAEYVSIIGAPFAITVIGGLSFSTIFTLLFVPTMYYGLENALTWLRNLPLKVKLLQFLLLIVGSYLAYSNIDSILWRMLLFILLILLIPGITWFVQTTLRRAGSRIISSEEPIQIRIQNL
ncbi:MAG: efflux RND transporter permease subunit, partial [Bacteroidales bacterium]|nr:efflux RND transporter permease subunit [Bacteroidales bacterium]